MNAKHLFLILISPLLFIANAFAGLSEYDANAPLGFGRNTTGGKGGDCVTVSSVDELKSALGQSGKLEIYIKGAIKFTSLLKVKNVKDKSVYGLPGSYLYSEMQEKSTSGILYFSGADNLILRNITFKGAGAYDCDGNDNLCIDRCTNVWIDHCDFQDGVDGNFDCKNQSDNICVSWCRFHYLKPPKAGGSGGSNDHRFTNLWGSSDTATGDRDKLNTTFVCCWWDEGCKERMPRIRFGKVHLVNCLWSSTVTNYCVGLGQESMAYVEKCAFINVKDPLKDYDKESKSGGILVDCYLNNVSNNGGSNSAIRNCTFNPSAYYTNNIAKMSAYQVQSVVSNQNNGAGATLSITACGDVNNDNPDPNPNEDVKAEPIITKHGSGSSTQTIVLGESIASFNYTYENCEDVKVEGMPEGIVISKGNGKVSFSGTPTQDGVFNFTITAIGGISEVSKNGTITVNMPTGIENVATKEVSIQPTIVKNRFSVKGCDEANVAVLNMLGTVVIETQKLDVDCSSLPSGIYIVKVQANNKSHTFRIVKR